MAVAWAKAVSQSREKMIDREVKRFEVFTLHTSEPFDQATAQAAWGNKSRGHIRT